MLLSNLDRYVPHLDWYLPHLDWYLPHLDWYLPHLDRGLHHGCRTRIFKNNEKLNKSGPFSLMAHKLQM
ncbi:unnamed protein product [Arctogadus glacialis]